MKKTLLFFCFLAINIVVIYGQIAGPGSLYVGQSAGCCVMSSFAERVAWSSSGSVTVSGSGSCATVKASKIGLGIINAIVYRENSSSVVGRYMDMVFVVDNPSLPPTNFSVVGPKALRVNEIVTYKTKDPTDIIVDADYFQVIEQSRSIVKVKAKKIGRTNVDAMVGNSIVSSIMITISEPNFTISTTASSPLCNNCNITYNLNNTQEGDRITWEAVRNLTLVSGQGTKNAVFKANGRGGYGIVRAKVNFNGGEKIVENNSIWVGTPVINDVVGERRIPNGQYARFQAKYDYNSRPTSFQWILNPASGGNVYGANTESVDIAFYNVGTYQLVVRATNMNGTGEYFVTGCSVYNANSYSYQIYPSPASDVLIVGFDTKISDGNSLEFATKGVMSLYKIYLYNENGSLVRHTTSEGSQIQFDVSNLSNGFYYLHIDDGSGEKPEMQKIIIKH